MRRSHGKSMREHKEWPRRLSPAWLWKDFRQFHFGRSVTCKISVPVMKITCTTKSKQLLMVYYKQLTQWTHALLINKDLRPEHFILEWSTCKEHDGVSGTQQALNGATRNADRIWKEVAANITKRPHGDCKTKQQRLRPCTLPKLGLNKRRMQDNVQ